MSDTEELRRLLRELNTPDNSTQVKEKAAEFIKNMDAKTLSLAETELMQEGMSQDELRILCDVHLAVYGDERQRQQSEMAAIHPIGILIDEHKIILRNLEELRSIVEQAEAARDFGEIGDQLSRLKAISHLLINTESHHQREEEALFPRLEKHDVTETPQVMRLEHEELRAGKKRLAELVVRTESMDYREFARELGKAGSYITDALRDHIFKEDNILYPTALQILRPEEWSKVAEEFDSIGYCYFTPRPANMDNLVGG